MAHICFLTFYDMICIGPRLLSSILKENGHKASLIIFKGEKYDDVIAEHRKDLKCYSYYREGIIRGSLYDIDSWTEEDETRLIELIKEISPDILGISTRSFWVELGYKLSRKIRDTFPDMPIIAGGWGPTLEPEKFLEFCDYVFFGEGDEVITDIADAYDRNRDFKELRNVVYAQNGTIVRNQVCKPIKDLDSLPFPDFELRDKYLITEGRIQKGEDFYNPKMYDIFAGRGCPLDCSYCMSSKWQKLYRDEYNTPCRKQRWKSVDRVLEEIEKAKNNGAVYIRLKDEVFPIHKEWIREFIPKYKERIGLPFSGYLRPEWHDRQIIYELYDAGFRSSAVGIQSGSEYMRKEVYNRHFKKDGLIEFTNTLKELGILSEYNLLAYCPIEEEKHMKETLNFLYELPYGLLKVYTLFFFPKAPITEMIGDRKQSAEKDKLDAWYIRLYTMALKGESWRKLSKTIYETEMFKDCPEVLSLLFTKEWEKEQERLKSQRGKYGAQSFSILEDLSGNERRKK